MCEVVIIHPNPLGEDQANRGQPSSSITYAVCLAQAHRAQDFALASGCSSLVRLQSCAEKRCFWRGSKCVLQSCLNIAQGNRNAGQGSEHSKKATGLTAHSSASLPSLQPARRDAEKAEQARAVLEPESMPGAQKGRIIVYNFPQASSAMLGLRTPLALGIRKSTSKGFAMTSGM